MKINILFSALFILIALCCGCSTSLIYSPGLNPDNDQMKNGEVEISGNAALMPETRPEALEELTETEETILNKTSMGLDGRLAYGFSDNFNLQIRVWADIEQRSFDRGGFALSSSFYFNEDSRLKYFFKPGFGIVTNLGVQGYGFELPAGIIYENSENIYTYAGLGFMLGYRMLDKDNEKGNYEYGYALLGHLGAGWKLSGTFRINAELIPIYQINQYDETTNFIVSPSIGLSARF